MVLSRLLMAAPSEMGQRVVHDHGGDESLMVELLWLVAVCLQDGLHGLIGEVLLGESAPAMGILPVRQLNPAR